MRSAELTKEFGLQVIGIFCLRVSEFVVYW